MLSLNMTNININKYTLFAKVKKPEVHATGSYSLPQKTVLPALPETPGLSQVFTSVTYTSLCYSRYIHIYIFIKNIYTAVSVQTYCCYHCSFDILAHITLLGMTHPTSAFDWQHPTCVWDTHQRLNRGRCLTL